MFGHGASGDRHQTPIPYVARKLVAECGFSALAIDGPVHGRRKVGDGARGAFAVEWRREGCVDDMLGDWRAALDAVQRLDEIGQGPVGYWGLSMGTIFGAPLVAAEPRIRVVVLGLMGIFGPTDGYRERIRAAAAAITCPVLFLMQLEDELFTREHYLDLFDRLASTDKRIHANPGLHPEVPVENSIFPPGSCSAISQATASRRSSSRSAFRNDRIARVGAGAFGAERRVCDVVDEYVRRSRA
jgi:pimeloyl-ACP methyl ester carboxylesterase